MREAIETFIKIAGGAWAELVASVDPKQKRDFMSTWLQFNWEMIVEGSLQALDPAIVLEPYGEGAETPTGRVLESSESTTHTVYCRSCTHRQLRELKSNEMVTFPEVGFPFEQFGASRLDGSYGYEPPFNAVILSLVSVESQTRDIGFFLLEEVEFHLQSITRGDAEVTKGSAKGKLFG